MILYLFRTHVDCVWLTYAFFVCILRRAHELHANALAWALRAETRASLVRLLSHVARYVTSLDAQSEALEQALRAKGICMQDATGWIGVVLSLRETADMTRLRL